jgi:hypothetical protein
MSETIIKELDILIGEVDISELSPELFKDEFARLNKSYEFHIDFALKVVAFFYAAVGGVLSVYFGVNEKMNYAVVVLLGIPIIMSCVLGKYFYLGATLWEGQAVYLLRLAKKLFITRPPQVMILGPLFRIFGGLFYATCFALSCLLVFVVIKLMRS